MPIKISQLLSDLRIAQRSAWERGEQILVESYLQRYPELASHEESVLDFIYSEYCLREELGNRPTPVEYANRFPRWEDTLRRLFGVHHAVESLDNTDVFDSNDFQSFRSDKAAIDSPLYIGRYQVEKVLGRGAFGEVYLVHDDQLQRRVTIKIPHARLIARPDQANDYLTEARIVAELDHPHIVSVYDVGSSDSFPCYIVSKYIDGVDLATKLNQERFTIRQTVELIATVAEALNHAHKHGLVHRDVKPANILLDSQGQAFITDFGLALRERDFGKGSQYAGTPAYMSPEQARGEGHRVDGRSDIFSLAVVFYEMLTGQRPFNADSQQELLKQITTYELLAPRLHDDTIPRELDRICMKALSKLASDRYSTAIGMAEDLRSCLANLPISKMSSINDHPSSKSEELAGDRAPMVTSASQSQLIKIVPKGLRSFDAHDADFFLELLPGARDRNGLPDTIRFWKNRIEETDADQTFTVGLIYGPSGCGKSSFVKAGLLPHLSPSVITIYVEATAGEADARLLNGLRKRCPSLPSDLGLKEAMTILRRGRGIPIGRKIVIILDQFEQWLHGKREESNTELVQALRHCDGERIQCIVMVRDDFWMSATRFMRELEVPLLEGQNSAAVDLFPIRHAENVLAAFGRAFGRLPAKITDSSSDQKEFVKQAVASLTHEGKVISVRLSLFAEMMKEKPWTPESLDAVGGIEGVGATFLEETFSAASAPPKHRYHQEAARAVLKSLLPNAGTDIKGHMRSYDELLEASGYATRPKDFDDLMRILDNEIRLITPTDPEGNEENNIISGSLLPGTPGRRAGDEGLNCQVGTATHTARSLPKTSDDGQADFSSDSAPHAPAPSPQKTGARGRKEISSSSSPSENESPQLKIKNQKSSILHYQLTHDYLVPSLRDWLTRKQRETRTGRAELMLAERASYWHLKRENRNLPSLLEWITIRTLTQAKHWNEPQRAMMRCAGIRYELRTAMTAVFTAILIATGIGIWTHLDRIKSEAEATRLVDGLLKADTTQVNSSIAEFSPFWIWADPQLQQAFAASDDGSNAKLHAAMALISESKTPSPEIVRFLADRLLVVTPTQLGPVRSVVAVCKSELAPFYWQLAMNEQEPALQRFHAAVALAGFEPKHANWDDSHLCKFLAEQLISTNPIYISQYQELVRPIAAKLVPALTEHFQDRSQSELAHTLNTSLLSDFAANDPGVLTELILIADETSYRSLFPLLEKHGQVAIEHLESVMERRLAIDWKDPPHDVDWIEPTLAQRDSIENAHGMLTDRYAFCQDMPVDEFFELAESLRTCGYRPTRVRPWQHETIARIAAVWTRDSKRWRLEPNVSKAELPTIDLPAARDGLWLADLACMNMAIDAGDVKYVTLWVEPSSLDEQRRLVVDVTEKELKAASEWLREQNFQSQMTVSVWSDSEQERHYSGIWSNQGPTTECRSAYAGFERMGEPQRDVAVAQVNVVGFVDPLEPYRQQLVDFEKLSAEEMDDLRVRYRRVLANYQLDKMSAALSDLDFIIEKNAFRYTDLRYRTLTLVRLGRTDEAKASLKRFLSKDGTEWEETLVSMHFSAWSGDSERAWTLLESAVEKFMNYPVDQFNLACAAAICAKALDATKPEEVPRFAGVAMDLLQELVGQGYRDSKQIKSSVDLLCLHSDPRFQALLDQLDPPARYAAVWSADVNCESKLEISDMEDILERAKVQIAQGYRPIAIAVDRHAKGMISGYVSPDRSDAISTHLKFLISNVLFQRPLIPDPEKEQLAKQQANAAIGLLRMGHPEKVWALLRHSPDPRLRSILIHRLSPLGADAQSIFDRFDQEADISIQRALLLSLGEFNVDSLTSKEPSRLQAMLSKVRSVYQNSPDPGLHVASEWLLRQWNDETWLQETNQKWSTDKLQRELRLENISMSLANETPSTQWYVNGQGQTMVVIPGPVEFIMGSPIAQEGRGSDEVPHRQRIRRTFALGAKLVTVGEYRRFDRRFTVEHRFALSADCPACYTTWFDGAAYCNWLSKEEGIPEDQWCFDISDEETKLKANYLHLSGYRLPTESEIEYVTRAGAITSRYYGESEELLGKYAWYAKSSHDRAWPVGSLKPNDLGIFDALGNAYVWCLDRKKFHTAEDDNRVVDDAEGQTHLVVVENSSRNLRGGGFSSRSSDVRSANRSSNLPAYQTLTNGFRIARTISQ